LSAPAAASTWPVAAVAAYAGLACGTSCEEVSPRPVRTDAALGLRAFWGSDGADGGQDRTDPPTPLAGADPAPYHDVRQSKKQLVVGVSVVVLADRHRCTEEPGQVHPHVTDVPDPVIESIPRGMAEKLEPAEAPRGAGSTVGSCRRPPARGVSTSRSRTRTTCCAAGPMRRPSLDPKPDGRRA